MTACVFFFSLGVSPHAGACTCSSTKISSTILCCYFLLLCTPLHVYCSAEQNALLWVGCPFLPTPGILDEPGQTWRRGDTLAGNRSVSLEDPDSSFSGTRSTCSVPLFIFFLQILLQQTGLRHHKLHVHTVWTHPMGSTLLM